ncbi:MAG: hypothetical protein ACLU0O_08360 [Collinsella sp.]
MLSHYQGTEYDATAARYARHARRLSSHRHQPQQSARRAAAAPMRSRRIAVQWMAFGSNRLTRSCCTPTSRSCPSTTQTQARVTSRTSTGPTA